MFGLSVTVLVGGVGLAIDVGQWEFAHKNLQRAADAAAMSAAVAYQATGPTLASSSNILSNTGQVIAAQYNYVDGAGGTSVTINNPPASGPNTGKTNAVEAIISQPQARIFSSVFGSGTVPERGRAVAVAGAAACVLALDPTAAGAVSEQGSVSVTANGCSIYSDSNSSTAISSGGSATASALSFSAVGGISGETNMTTSAPDAFYPNSPPIGDPYSNVDIPSFSGCDQTKFKPKTSQTITPGVYCGGFDLEAGVSITMSPGIYYMDQGAFTVNGSATLTGTGVTIIFTSSAANTSNPNWPTANIAGGANVNLTAPSTGTTAGIVLFGDRRMTVQTSYSLAGGTSQIFNGAVYLPKAAIKYAGGASSNNGCNQVIGDTVQFTGGSALGINCAGMGVREIGVAAQLLE